MTTISDEGAAKAVRHLEIHAVPTQATPLLPDHVCDAIIARAKIAYPPMGERVAKLAAAKFLSGRPYLADKNGVTIDKQVYFKSLTEVFAAFPEWVGVNVTTVGSDFRRAHSTFLPTADDLFEALTKEAGRDHVAAYRAGLHRKEAERRAVEDDVELPPERRAAMAERMKDLAAKLKSTPVIEPVAGKDPVDLEAQKRRQECLSDLERRKSMRTPEEQAEMDRINEWLVSQRGVKTA